MSLREIARRTGVPKTSIREALNANGMALRSYTFGRKRSAKMDSVQKPGLPPYGYGYIDGQLALDPREYSVVQQILNLWKLGKGFQAIADHLNGNKILSRNQKQWTRCVVKRIVQRHESKIAKPERE